MHSLYSYQRLFSGLCLDSHLLWSVYEDILNKCTYVYINIEQKKLV